MDKLQEHSIPIAPPSEQMGCIGSMKEAIKAPRPQNETMDREDAGMLFRCFIQAARYLAKKYGFTIKQWPEK